MAITMTKSNRRAMARRVVVIRPIVGRDVGELNGLRSLIPAAATIFRHRERRLQKQLPNLRQGRLARGDCGANSMQGTIGAR
jgi:hypothetical protein